MAATMAAPAVFERSRSARAVVRDRALLDAAARLDRFTTAQVARDAGNTHWYGAASVLLRHLRAEGHVRIVSPEGAKPFVFEWCEP